MQKILTTLFLFFALLPSARSEWSEWKEQDKILFVASSVAIVADWATTRYYARNQSTLYPYSYESNAILGPRPSVSRLDFYMLTMLISNYYIADWVSEDHRSFYLIVRTVNHGLAAHRNQTVFGWQMRF